MRITPELPIPARTLRAIADALSPKRPDAGRPSDAPIMALYAEKKLALREDLLRSLSLERAPEKPSEWPESAGDFETARERWKGQSFSKYPGTVASVWLYEIEQGRGAVPPTKEKAKARSVVKYSRALVDRLKKTIRRSEERSVKV